MGRRAQNPTPSPRLPLLLGRALPPPAGAPGSCLSRESSERPVCRRIRHTLFCAHVSFHTLPWTSPFQTLFHILPLTSPFYWCSRLLQGSTSVPTDSAPSPLCSRTLSQSPFHSLPFILRSYTQPLARWHSHCPSHSAFHTPPFTLSSSISACSSCAHS